ncbi:MAG: hypothetical protein M1147_05965 [Nitrospirae bacterium]|nr:hypothetical protein [Nitrospirota bacterium]
MTNKDILDNCWAIFIDIEGFSKIYRSSKPFQAMRLLQNLMKYLYLIGNKVYPDAPERLSVYHLCDSFLIVSDPIEENLERPVSIAIALMQALLLEDGIISAGISSGQFGDFRSYYPEEIRADINEYGIAKIGDGLMTIFQVMGEALINSVKLLEKKPKDKGPCLSKLPENPELLSSGMNGYP